ncbi:methyltransferase domain-containing protein [Sulfuricurvum sp.]|uniref:methyltransferase domain-containing protein n=1 Tax=Sulfuricurvum sp. TaxID=2025608 RepID=UPI002639F0D5|nr:methyltransferase domain-containing protein [Sulfuricurvum sp.]MDD2780909.1 methyltransferase domain-containing protein [Sulfuricurvum sp.]
MKIIYQLLNLYIEHGLKRTFLIVLNRFYRQKPKSFAIVKQIILNGKGLEIGGPSQIFTDNGIFPVYQSINLLDNSNFSNHTLWNTQQEGYHYCYSHSQKIGYQYILDGIEMSPIPSRSYDFMLSSHVLEHIANPIKALYEWKRILKDNGYLILLLPHKDGTFDHLRPPTTIEHLIEDYSVNIQENDLTHLEEILSLHDLSRDTGAGSFQEFKSRSLNNFENRALHHHVFTTRIAIKMIDYIKMEIICVEAIWPMHILVVAKNNSAYADQMNKAFFKSQLISPFPSDNT